MFKYIALFVVALSSLYAQVTNSSIPVIEQFEAHPLKKWSDRRHSTVVQALEKQSEKIRVVSYNILFDLFDHTLQDDTHSWKNRLPRILESIKQMQPDILCLQEPYERQLADLREALKEGYLSFVGETAQGELNAIFYNKERFQLDASKSASIQMPLNPKDDPIIAEVPNFLPIHLEPGLLLTKAYLFDRVTGVHFCVLNTHLTFYRVNAREDQAYFIADLIRNEPQPVIFTGDLNTLPNWPAHEPFRHLDGGHIEELFEQVAKNSRRSALLGHVGPHFTYLKYFYKKNHASPLEELGNQAVFLDHIYVTEGITTLISGVEASKVDGYYPSDHLPIIADIIFTKDF